MSTTPTVPEALRALADALERHPTLPAPELSISRPDDQALQAWTAVAITDDLPIRRSRTEHATELWIPSLRLRVVAVTEQSMRRHYAEAAVRKRHADEVDALLAEPVTA